MKKCRACGTDKQDDDFYERGYRCKECTRQAATDRYHGRPVKPMPRSRNAPPGMRRCTVCAEIRPLDDFYAKSYQCKPCVRDANKARYWSNPQLSKDANKGWRERNADLLRERRLSEKGKARRRRFLLLRYNITVEEWEELFKIQGGGCAICRRPQLDTPKGRLHIDHDHSCCAETGQSCGKCIRGLLCYECNTAVGLLHDDPERLRSALRYLGA